MKCENNFEEKLKNADSYWKIISGGFILIALAVLVF